MMRPFIIKKNGVDLAEEIRKYRVFKSFPESMQMTEKTYYGEGFVEPKIPPEVLLSLLELNPQHSSACSIKANDIIKTGYVLEGEDSEMAREFFQTCRPSFEVILHRALEDLQVFNYCTLEVVRDSDGRPVFLEYVPAHTVRVHESKKKYIQTVNGVDRVYFKDYTAEEEIDYETGQVTDDPERFANEMIFMALPSTMCSYYGVPKYISAIPSMLALNKVNEYNYAFFENYTVPSYAITITGDFEDYEETDSQGNPTGRTVLQALIEENFEYISKNPQSPIVLSVPGGDTVKVNFVPLSSSAHESSFRGYEDDRKLDIAAAHMIDPYSIGVFETGPLGGNLAEETKKNYYEAVIRPQRHLIATVFTDFLQSRFGWDGERADVQFRFNDELLLASEVIKNYVLLIQNGVMTPAEAREQLFGLQDGLQYYFTPAGPMNKPSVKRRMFKRRDEEKQWAKILEEVYSAYKDRITDVMNTELKPEEKKGQIDIILEEMRQEAYKVTDQLIDDSVKRGITNAIESGIGQIPLEPNNLKEYQRLQHASIDDMIERIRHYTYKVVGLEAI